MNENSGDQSIQVARNKRQALMESSRTESISSAAGPASRRESITAGSSRWSSLVVLAMIAMMAVIASPGRAASSCWASNPDGTRVCADFEKPGISMVEHLCEDQPGDCAKLGYQPAVSPSSRELDADKQVSDSDDEAAPAATPDSGAEDASTSSSSDDETTTENSQEAHGDHTLGLFLVYGLGVALLLFVLGVMLEASGYPAFGSALKWLGGGVVMIWIFLVVFLVTVVRSAGSDKNQTV